LQYSEGIKSKYPEIYSSGTSEGDGALSYFEKWGWYATIYALMKPMRMTMEKILNKDAGETLLFLAHWLDRQKFMASQRKKKPGTTTTQL
jgi:hypothetical protein